MNRKSVIKFEDVDDENEDEEREVGYSFNSCFLLNIFSINTVCAPFAYARFQFIFERNSAAYMYQHTQTEISMITK